MIAVSEVLLKLNDNQTVLRCFYIPVSQLRTLNNLASHRRVSVDELVVEAIQAHLQSIEDDFTEFPQKKVEGDYSILRTFYITLEQGRRLNDLALARKTTTTKLLSEILNRYLAS